MGVFMPGKNVKPVTPQETGPTTQRYEELDAAERQPKNFYRNM